MGQSPIESWEKRVEEGKVTPAVGNGGEKGVVEKEGGLYFFRSGVIALVYESIKFLKEQTRKAIEAAQKKN